jgi:hypothetical protein
VGHWLQVRALDPQLNRDAFGAKITVQAGDRRWMQTVSPGQSYISAHDVRVHFGLGDINAIESVHVRWPDGLTETFQPDCLDCNVTVLRGSGKSSLEGRGAGNTSAYVYGK